jgi:hypothetical protein
MKSYPSGVAVSLTFPLVDFKGDPVTPTGLSVRVFDENEIEVVGSQSIVFNPGDPEIEFTVSAIANTLSGATRIGYRQVELIMTLAEGSYTVSQGYGVKANVQLGVLENSFQTFGNALVLAETMPNLSGWIAATDSDRIAALIEAFTRLTRFGYLVKWPRDPDAQNSIAWFDSRNEIIVPRLWTMMSVERFMTLYPEAFRLAIRKAQISEANQILSGDIIADKRRAGIVSEKTGESSMTFNSSKPLNLGISQQAFQYITGYIDIKITLTRS